MGFSYIQGQFRSFRSQSQKNSTAFQSVSGAILRRMKEVSVLFHGVSVNSRSGTMRSQGRFRVT